ncbi:MAG: ATP-binding protein [Candidatus Thermoplasmatota archaeon]|nr:ATP-binding protein [Candidatus Thermoplasmatota archaeon]
MEEITFIILSMIFTGTLFLTYGIHKSILLRKNVPPFLKSKWNIITILMIIFLVSYFLSMLILSFEFNIAYMTGFVFLGGAIFVAIIISLSSKTIYSMVEKEKLEKLYKKLEQHDSFLDNVLESLTHPFYVIDVNTYRLKLANSASRLGSFGNESTCYSLTHKRNNPCGSKEHICPLEEVKKTKKPCTVEHIHYDNDDHPRNMEVHAYPIFDEKGLLKEMIEYSLDITEKTKIKKALELSKEELKKLVHQKNEFINQLGHDIKNPLTPITRLLPKVIRDTRGKKNLERLEIINRNIDYIKNLVLKTLKLAKLNTANIQFNFQETNILDVMNEALLDNKFLLEESNISINNLIDKDEITLSIDNLQFKEVFNNLFSNAVKYIEGKGLITINANEKDNYFIFSIKDNGIGMSKDQVSQLFNEFYKADESRHDFYSTGLGLSITKKIIERHGGKIWAESEGLGKGSIFYFTIPTKINIHNKGNINSIHKQVDKL